MKPSDVTMTVTPNPVPAFGFIFTVAASGFTPGNAVNFVLSGVATYARADSEGKAQTIYTSWWPGTFTAFVKEWTNHGHRYREVASITFNVIPSGME